MKRLIALIAVVGLLAAPAIAQTGGLLWDNGDFITGDGCGGPDTASSIEPPSTLYGNSILSGFWGQADDFTVPGGETWTLEELNWRMYQSNSPTTEPITGAFVTLFEGPPTLGVVVAGDFTTDRLISSAFSGIYRDNSDFSCARAIKDTEIDMTWAPPLGSGNYFIGIQATGSPNYSGPWSGHKVPRGPGNNPIGAEDNSHLYDEGAGGVWTLNIDTNTGASWDYPFQLFGDGGGGMMIDVEGDCSPGTVTVTVQGATPGGLVAIVGGPNAGTCEIPGGPCAGTTVGFDCTGARLIALDTADPDGVAVLRGPCPRIASGWYIQALDVPTCETSNVVQLP